MHNMKFSFFIIVWAFMQLILVSTISAAHADMYNPGLYSTNSKPFGLTFSQWSEKWWQWQSSIPVPNSPLRDADGKNCGNGQNDPNVWFMTGIDSGTVIRSCTIPSSKAILIQPVGNECSYAENPGSTTEQSLRKCAITGDQPTSMSVTIDGRPIQNLQHYTVQTPLFDLSLPENNIYGAPAGPTKSVGHAYMIFLQPLKPGKHEIHFAQSTDPGSPNGFSYDVTHHVTTN